MASDTFLVAGSISAAVACIVAVIAKSLRDKRAFSLRDVSPGVTDEMRVWPREKEADISSGIGGGEIAIVNIGGQRYWMPTHSKSRPREFREFDLTVAEIVHELQVLQPQVTLELEGGSSLVLRGNIALKAEVVRQLLDENKIHVVNVLPANIA